MPIPLDVVKCYKHIDLHSKKYIEDLKYLIKIESVSSDTGAVSHLTTSITWISNKLKSLGFTIIIKTPDYKNYKGNKPNIIIGTLGNDPKKKTLLYYCHLDVLKVVKSEWKTDAFQLTEKDGRLYGRGTAKMKGPLLCFLHAIEAYQDLGIEIPINIKIICEAMNECKSKGLSSVLHEEKMTFLPNVDCVLITDSHWLGKDYPCIVYGMRGVCYFNLSIDGPANDLNSGDFGGIVREPMQDMLCIFNNLIDPHGTVKVPYFYDDVVPVTPDEEEFYHKIKMDTKEYRKTAGVNKLGHREQLKMVLMHVWRYPWFNLHYIQTSCDFSNLLNIPKKIFLRFSIRTVPNQKQEKIQQSIISFINNVTTQMKTPNKITVNLEQSLDPWYENHLHWNYEAANVATKQVYKEEASFIREGNGFPTLLKLRDALPGRNILVLPIVDSESRAHNEDENISVRCYIEGTKILVSYFYELREAARRHEKAAAKNRRSNVCRDRL